MPDADLGDVRRRYAADVLAAANVWDDRIEHAFAAIPREAFLPPGPWTIKQRGQAERTPDDDPARIYRNVLVALDPERGINNGEPALHAAWLKAVGPEPGESVVHVGAGTGYYTAILASLVSPGGQVCAYEIDPGLAANAARNLAATLGVTVHSGSALGAPLPDADVIYVNAALAAPDPDWLRAMKPGGRLIMPWQAPAERWGHALRIVRRPGGFAARAGMSVGFIRCVGGPGSAQSLSEAAIRATRSVRVTAEREPDETATAVFPAVWFSSREVGPV